MKFITDSVDVLVFEPSCSAEHKVISACSRQTNGSSVAQK